MRIVYYDESGDDGYPQFSSPLFSLTAIYMHYLSWKGNYEIIKDLRSKLKAEFNFPIKLEMHTKYFLLDKHPYRDFNFLHNNKKQIISLFCQFIAHLDLKVINTISMCGLDDITAPLVAAAGAMCKDKIKK